jgi:hypothetical protein
VTATTVTRPRHPVLVTRGPAAFSSCTALARACLKWDANGYYRALGVSPDASRAELVAAYLDAGGPQSGELTFALSQLLDRGTRAAYDNTPLGRRFADEQTIEARLREIISTAGLASGCLKREDDLTAPRQDEYPYGFYLWRTADADEETLIRWQALVIGALARIGHEIAVSIGVSGGTRPDAELIWVGATAVFYLHERSTPNAELADALAVSAATLQNPSEPPKTQGAR